MGGTDGHGLNWHHGICRMEDSHRAGLTAVITDEVTRQGVLDALARRRCYATSGARIGLWFEVEGVLMGDEVPPRREFIGSNRRLPEASTLPVSGGWPSEELRTRRASEGYDNPESAPADRVM